MEVCSNAARRRPLYGAVRFELATPHRRAGANTAAAANLFWRADRSRARDPPPLAPQSEAPCSCAANERQTQALQDARQRPPRGSPRTGRVGMSVAGSIKPPHAAQIEQPRGNSALRKYMYRLCLAIRFGPRCAGNAVRGPKSSKTPRTSASWRNDVDEFPSLSHRLAQAQHNRQGAYASWCHSRNGSRGTACRPWLCFSRATYPA